MYDILSPGVKIRELDYSDYVSNASTCVLGMVGEARRGPVGVPTLVTNQKDLIKIFGEPKEGCYGIYSALAFLTEGSQLLYCRVVAGGVKATAGVVGTDKVIFEACGAGESYNGISIEIVSNDGNFDIVVKRGEQNLESYEGLTVGSENNVETIINSNSSILKAHIQIGGTVTSKTLTMEGGSGSAGYATANAEGNAATKISFRTKYADSTLNGGTIVLSEMVNGYFDVTVKDVSNTVVETWNSLCLTDGDDRNVEIFINKYSDRIVATVDDSVGAPEYEDITLTISGGSDGIANLSDEDYIGTENDGLGLYAFSNEETTDISLLCVPGKYQEDIINAAITICEKRNDCMFIIDTPFGLKPKQVISWANGTNSGYGTTSFNSSFAAIYWPWVKVADSYTKKDIWLPASGYIAAQYAYSDKVGFPWFAPAGLNRGKLVRPIGIEHSPTQGERDALYGNRNVINCIANFIGDGLVIWGQKTTQRKPTALDRVNVRRLLNYLKKTIGASTKYFVFEQNTRQTWDRWKCMVEPVLRNVKDNDGLVEYRLEVDPTTFEIENGYMPVTVRIKPTKTAEFIPLNFMIMSQSYSFEE